MNIFKTKCIILDFDFPKRFKVNKYNKHYKYELLLFSILLLDRGLGDIISDYKNNKPEDDLFQVTNEEFFKNDISCYMDYRMPSYILYNKLNKSLEEIQKSRIK